MPRIVSDEQYQQFLEGLNLSREGNRLVDSSLVHIVETAVDSRTTVQSQDVVLNGMQMAMEDWPEYVPPVDPEEPTDPTDPTIYQDHQYITSDRSNFEIVREIDWDALRSSYEGRDIPDQIAWAAIVQGEVTLSKFKINSNSGGIGAFGGDDRLTLREFEIWNCGGPEWMDGNGLYHLYLQGWLDMEDGYFGAVGEGLKNGNPIHNHAGQRQSRMTLLRMKNIVYRNGQDILIDEFDRWEMDNVDTDAYSIDVGYQSSLPNGVFIAHDLKAPQLKFRLPLEEVFLTGIDGIRHFNWRGGPGFDPTNPNSWAFCPKVTIDGTRIK